MIKPTAKGWIALGVVFFCAALVAWFFLSAPKNPAAVVRVMDSAGKPILGAVLTPRGLRTKPGPYQSGWYGWGGDTNRPAPTPVKTDARGEARIEYPKYVFEKIETGVIIFSVSHPDYVPDEPERVVTTKPPAGTPWKVWFDYVKDRLQHKHLVTQVDPVVLKHGAILEVAARADSDALKGAKMFVQVSGDIGEDENFWQRPEPGTILTRRLPEGIRTIRAIEFDATETPWFSDIASIHAVAGKTNHEAVSFTRGVTLRGQLDRSVPRPVKSGRVIASVMPRGMASKDSPPRWHAWTKVRDDGGFEIKGLPQGDLEVVALCDGYINTNGPGTTKMRYPQKHVLGTNDLDISIGMEKTARLEVSVYDKEGKPVKGATAGAWPNVRYGDWWATIVASDCYNTADDMLPRPGRKPWVWSRTAVPDFMGTSDENGIAVIPNLPADVTEIDVEHPKMVLPAVQTAWGQKRRYANVSLIAGTTNRISVTLEPEGQTPITHY